MPFPSEAKAKLQAVLEEAKTPKQSHFKNRVVTTRHPSSGSCEMTNSMSARRPSQGSAESGHGGGRLRTMIRNLMSPPAY